MPTQRRLAERDWCTPQKRQDGTMPSDRFHANAAAPRKMSGTQRKRRSDNRSAFNLDVVTVSDGRRSIRANHPAPATAEIATRRDEARTAIEAIATATIEAAAAAPATTATAAPATSAATTALRMRGSTACGQHDGGRTDQTNTINRDKRRGCEAAGQEVTALRCRLSHSWDLPFCRSTALECFRYRIVQQRYSASNSSSHMPIYRL